MQIAAFSSSPGTISTQVIIDDDDISQQNLESHLLRACTARAWSVADISRDCPNRYSPLPLLCYYRTRNCGGGIYERFYHHTIPEH